MTARVGGAMKKISWMTADFVKPVQRLPVARARFSENLGAPRPAPPLRTCACGRVFWTPELERTTCPSCGIARRVR
jgi:hypothetical protein